MNRLVAGLIGLTLLASPLAGCSDDCSELADIACERAGVSSEECQRIRDKADKPSAEDKRACELALRVVKDFTSQQ